MKRLLGTLSFVLLLSTSVAWSQGTPSRVPPTTPPIFPPDQQHPATKPDQLPGQPYPSTGAQTNETTSTDVQNRIQNALAKEPTLAKSSVAVAVTDEQVELTGSVSSSEEKRMAQHIAETNASGRKVVNHITIEKSHQSGPS